MAPRSGHPSSVKAKKPIPAHMKKAHDTDKPIAKIGRGGVPILENGLTVYQDRLIEAALQTGFRNMRKLCKFAGIPERNFYQWMQSSEVFRKAWEDTWGRQVNLHLPAVVDALAQRAITTGDPQAARLFLELAGKSKPQKLQALSDEELNARIIQLQKEAGVGAGPGGSGSTQERPRVESPAGTDRAGRPE